MGGNIDILTIIVLIVAVPVENRGGGRGGGGGGRGGGGGPVVIGGSRPGYVGPPRKETRCFEWSSWSGCNTVNTTCGFCKVSRRRDCFYKDDGSKCVSDCTTTGSRTGHLLNCQAPIRLKNATENYMGLIGLYRKEDVYLSGSSKTGDDWGTICAAGWDLSAAEVACRQLGFKGAEEAITDGRFGLQPSAFSLVNVQCQGNEKKLVQCRYSYIEGADVCRIQAGVKCYGGSKMGISTTLILVIVVVSLIAIAVLVIICKFINNCVQSQFDSFEQDNGDKDDENTIGLLDNAHDKNRDDVRLSVPNGNIGTGSPLSLSYSRHSLHSQHSGQIVDPHPEYVRQISSEPINPAYSAPLERQKLQKQFAFDRMEDSPLDKSKSRSRISFTPSESSHFSQYSWLQRLISENAANVANKTRRQSDVGPTTPRSPFMYRQSSIGSPIVENGECGKHPLLPRQQSSDAGHINDEPSVPPPTYMEAVKRTRSASI